MNSSTKEQSKKPMRKPLAQDETIARMIRAAVRKAMNGDRIDLARMAVMQLTQRERDQFLRTFSDPKPAAATNGPRVIRFGPAAESLSITPRALKYAMQSAGIKGVRLPGRSRAFGIRASDLEKLVEGEL